MDYVLPLIRKYEIAESTMAFEFKKPKKFTFIAGQTIDIGVGTMVYTFSIAAAPDEQVLRIATRMRKESKFKQALLKAKKVRMQGPSGDFVLPKNTKKKIILIAGGIGITPFYSMIKFKSSHQISLFYKNSSLAKTAFRDKLEWLNELPIDKKASYYIAGPPGFVAKYRAILDEAGINEDLVKTEEFSGY